MRATKPRLRKGYVLDRDDAAMISRLSIVYMDITKRLIPRATVLLHADPLFGY